MVVLLIIAILLAIAIPIFLSVSQAGKDRQAQANLYTSLNAARGFAYSSASTQSYGAQLLAYLQADEPGMPFTNTSSYGASGLSFSVSEDGNGVVFAQRAGTTCWVLADNFSYVTPNTSNYVGTNDYSNAVFFPGAGVGYYGSIPPNPGTYYGKMTGVPAASGNCEASNLWWGILPPSDVSSVSFAALG
jgi:type IV pilus assembly protein PilA